jgi:hypothetical protein
MTTFEISHIYNDINVLEGLPFTKCNCGSIICALECYTWKGNNICDKCYSKHSVERIQTRNKVEQYKPMKCTICSTIKSHPEHRFAYHAHDLFETTCIDKMINTGVEAEEICKEVERFEPLCIYCYDIIKEFENNFTLQKIKGKDVEVQELYEAHTKEMYKALHNLNQ